MTGAYSNNFSITQKGAELTVKFRLAEPEQSKGLALDDFPLEFNLSSLALEIRQLEHDLEDEMPSESDISQHPDLRLLCRAYQELETRALQAA
ncbi:MAG: hypothetical protein ACRBCT_06135 [Alphaproteobacteria bacterium]